MSTEKVQNVFSILQIILITLVVVLAVVFKQLSPIWGVIILFTYHLFPIIDNIMHCKKSCKIDLEKKLHNYNEKIKQK